MQSYRITTRLPQTLRVVKSPPMACYGTYSRPVRRINAFPQFSLAELSPFFRFFDEELNNSVSRPLRSWQPRFDVREEKDAFSLHGEIPGVDAKDVQIEFADDNTMVIRGRTVREHAKGNRPEATGAIQSSTLDKPIEETIHTSSNDAASDAGSTSSSYKKPTVEDEDFVDVAESEKSASVPEPSTAEIATAEAQQQEPEKKLHESKYWVSERSVGEFHRSFTFPGHVDQDAVTASLKNGILSVIVPKAVAREPRKITIH